MYEYVRRLLFSLDAERAHHLSMGAARLAQAVYPGVVDPMFAYEHPRLKTSVLGMHLQNPVGLAAGFDKNATLVPFWKHVGFGFAEVGSVSARRAKGNPRPRAFRLPDDEALINRMGLNNDGADRIARRLRKVSGPGGAGSPVPLGINLAKTHDPAIMGEAGVEDFRQSFRQLAPLASYIALNISCPNTAEGKTFEDPDALDALLTALFAERTELGLTVPVLLKLSPPETAKVVYDSLVEEVLALAQTHGVHGFIATNTASDRAGLDTDGAALASIGRGGLSGPPLAERATALVRYIYERTDGRLPIIGVGGIASAEDAYARLRAGASLVQLYTALVYEGPGLVRRIKEGLVHLLERDGFETVSSAVGADV